MAGDVISERTAFTLVEITTLGARFVIGEAEPPTNGGELVVLRGYMIVGEFSDVR